MDDYKSVLVRNNTQDCQVTLYVYSRHDPLCWISSSSKILSPGTSYLHRYEHEFKFEIKGIYKKKKKINLVNVRKWIKDTHITILECETVKEGDLQHYEKEKTICIRKQNVEKEVSLDHGRNLYEILKLNFEEIRKLNKDNQDKEIKTAFHKEIRRWHSDIAGELGDNAMAHEVIAAYYILRDREQRAEYHNKADYSKGWLSTSRWKSIFWPECETEEQIQKYRKRLKMLALSVFVGGCGLILSVSTAGAAAPAVVGICGTLGAGCIGGGVQSAIRTVNRKSIEKGCDVKDYVKSFGLGFLAGAVTGGAGVGISAGIAGIGSAATHVSAATVMELIGMGASSAAVGGAAFSLASDAEKILVDGVDMSWKQVFAHAIVGAVIGGVTGTAVGAVSGALAGLSAEISSTNIEGKLVPGLRRYCVSLAKMLSKGVTNKSAECVLESLARYIEERLDDELENRPVSEHILESRTKFFRNIVSGVTIAIAAATGENVLNENEVDRKIQKDDITNVNNVDDSANVDISDERYADSFDTSPNSLLTEQEQRQRIRCDLDQIARLKWSSTNVKATYNPPEHTKTQEKVSETSYDLADIIHDKVTSARFIYTSKGHWISKMIVEYTENGGKHQKKETKSGIALEIPIDAEDVKVYFKVMRFISVWCDVKKWNRFEKKWYDEPHVFKYEKTPEERRFTLDGSLYFEGIIHVTNERFDDVNEM